MFGFVITVLLSSFFIGAYTVTFYDSKQLTKLSTDSVRWNEFGGYLAGTVGPMIAIANVLAVLWVAAAVREYENSQREQTASKAATDLALAEAKTQVDRTLKHFDYFTDPVFYARVRAPAYHVAVQWAHAPPETRTLYQQTVVFGWAYTENDPTKLLAYLGNKRVQHLQNKTTGLNEIRKLHFQEPAGIERLSEHQALSAFLRFWVQTEELLEAKILDIKTANSLLAPQLAYYEDFFEQLSEKIIEAFAQLKLDNEPPTWVNGIRNLRKRFAIFEALQNLPPTV